MDKVEELLTRGVDKIYPSREEFEKELRSGKKLRVYQGFDPTGPDLHIGHMAGLRKLKQFQDLGHEVIFLIGDFTGMIGDPTGKDATRVPLTHEQVLENAKSYKEQAGKILRFEGENAVQIKYNSEWLAKMSAIEFAQITHHLSIQQIIERDMFQRRLKSNMNIAMSEFLYPVMQAYDSIAMDVDVEIGGTDQMFNMMLGRELMHKIKRKNKFVLTLPLLIDASGNKIGKSEGNVIKLTDKPSDLYGKIMSLSDDVIIKSLEYLTDVPMEEIKNMEEKIKAGENPLSFKKNLAYEIVKQLNNLEEAKNAESNFKSIVQDKNVPDDIVEIEFKSNQSLAATVLENNLVNSNSEWKRLIEQHGVYINDEKIENPFMRNDELPDNGVLKIGKRNYVKIKKS